MTTPRRITISYVWEDGGEFDIDSGAFVHVCPRKYAEEWLLLPATKELTLRSVTGKKLNIYGVREVKYEI